MDIKKIHSIVKDIEESKSMMEPLWSQIAKWLTPESGQFFNITKKEKEYRIDMNRYREMIDILPVWALKTATSGILNALTPENRKWFSFENRDDVFENYGLAKKIEEETYEAQHRDGFYSLMERGIKELNAFGTFTVRKQFTKDGLKFIKLPIGSYSIGQNIYEEIDKVSVRYEYQKQNFIEEFGEIFTDLKQMKETDSVEFFTLLIKNYDKEKDDKGRVKKWIEYYVFKNHIFKQEGYDINPYCIARFDPSQTKNGWGVGNGIRSIASIKSLQMLMMEICNAVEKMLNPAIAVDISLFENGNIELRSGSVNVVNRSNGNLKDTITNMQDIRFNLESAGFLLDKLTQMIYKIIEADIFISVSGAGKQMTAYETAVLEQEKLLRLGSLSANISKDFIRPILMSYVEYYYDKHGVKLNERIDVKFYGYMALAQKMQDVNNLQQGVNIIGQIAHLMPEILDFIKVDKMPAQIAKALNLSSDFFASPEEVETKRNNRIQQGDSFQEVIKMQPINTEALAREEGV